MQYPFEGDGVAPFTGWAGRGQVTWTASLPISGNTSESECAGESTSRLGVGEGAAEVCADDEVEMALCRGSAALLGLLPSEDVSNGMVYM